MIIGNIVLFYYVEHGIYLDNFYFIVVILLISIWVNYTILLFRIEGLTLRQRTTKFFAINNGALDAMTRAFDRDNLWRLNIVLEYGSQRVMRLAHDTLLK